jgi:hypothetical protein
MTASVALVALSLVACAHSLPATAEGGNPMTTLQPVRHVSVSIARAPADVYAFASDPTNLPRWASGLAGKVEQVDGEWVGEGPTGKVRIRFTPRNDLGVLDHDVRPASGEVVHVPLRVIPNGGGSEVVLTVFGREGDPPGKLDEDARWVAKDLDALKRLLEP